MYTQVLPLCIILGLGEETGAGTEVPTAPLRLSRFLATCAFAPCVLVREGAMVKSRTKDQEDELKDLQTRFNFLGTPPSSAPR